MNDINHDIKNFRDLAKQLEACVLSDSADIDIIRDIYTKCKHDLNTVEKHIIRALESRNEAFFEELAQTSEEITRAIRMFEGFEKKKKEQKNKLTEYGYSQTNMENMLQYKERSLRDKEKDRERDRRKERDQNREREGERNRYKDKHRDRNDGRKTKERRHYKRKEDEKDVEKENERIKEKHKEKEKNRERDLAKTYIYFESSDDELKKKRAKKEERKLSKIIKEDEPFFPDDTQDRSKKKTKDIFLKNSVARNINDEQYDSDEKKRKLRKARKSTQCDFMNRIEECNNPDTKMYLDPDTFDLPNANKKIYSDTTFPTTVYVSEIINISTNNKNKQIEKTIYIVLMIKTLNNLICIKKRSKNKNVINGYANISEVFEFILPSHNQLFLSVDVIDSENGKCYYNCMINLNKIILQQNRYFSPTPFLLTEIEKEELEIEKEKEEEEEMEMEIENKNVNFSQFAKKKEVVKNPFLINTMNSENALFNNKQNVNKNMELTKNYYNGNNEMNLGHYNFNRKTDILHSGLSNFSNITSFDGFDKDFANFDEINNAASNTNLFFEENPINENINKNLKKEENKDVVKGNPYIIISIMTPNEDTDYETEIMKQNNLNFYKEMQNMYKKEKLFYENKNKENEKKIEELDKTVMLLELNNETYIDVNEKLKEIIEGKKGIIEKIEKILEEKNTEIEKLETENKKLNEVQKVIENNKKKIKKLISQISTLNINCKQYKMKLKDTNQINYNLNGKVNNLLFQLQNEQYKNEKLLSYLSYLWNNYNKMNFDALDNTFTHPFNFKKLFQKFSSNEKDHFTVPFNQFYNYSSGDDNLLADKLYTWNDISSSQNRNEKHSNDISSINSSMRINHKKGTKKMLKNKDSNKNKIKHEKLKKNKHTNTMDSTGEISVNGMINDDAFMLNQYKRFIGEGRENEMKQNKKKTETGKSSSHKIEKNYENKQISSKNKKQERSINDQFFISFSDEQNENDIKTTEKYAILPSANGSHSSVDTNLMKYDKKIFSGNIFEKVSNKSFSNDTFSIMGLEKLDKEREKNILSLEKKVENEKKKKINKAFTEKDQLFQKKSSSKDDFSFVEKNKYSQTSEEHNDTCYNNNSSSSEMNNNKRESAFAKIRKKKKKKYDKNTLKRETQKMVLLGEYEAYNSKEAYDISEKEKNINNKLNLQKDSKLEILFKEEKLETSIGTSSQRNTEDFISDYKTFEKKFNYFLNVSDNLKKNVAFQDASNFNETAKIHKNKNTFCKIEAIIEKFKNEKTTRFIQNALYKELNLKYYTPEVIGDHIKLLRKFYAKDYKGIIFKNSFIEVFAHVELENQEYEKYNNTHVKKEELIYLNILVKSVFFHILLIKGKLNEDNQTHVLLEKKYVRENKKPNHLMEPTEYIDLKKNEICLLYKLIYKKNEINYKQLFLNLECLANDNTKVQYKIALPFVHFFLFKPNSHHFNDFLKNYFNFLPDTFPKNTNHLNNNTSKNGNNHISQENNYFSKIFNSLVKDSLSLNRFIESIKMIGAFNFFYFNAHNVLYTSIHSKKKKCVLLIIYTFMKSKTGETIGKFQFISQSKDLVHLLYNLFCQVM